MAASGLVLNPSTVQDFKLAASPHDLEPFSPAGKPIQIYLAALEPALTMVPLQVSELDTIASIKIRIQARRGFYVDQQRLLYGGRELTQGERLLQDYGVRHGDVLHLVLRISDLVSITVKTVNEDTFVYSVRRSDSIRDLKQIISDRDGDLPSDQQLLTLRGEHLEDSIVIEDLFLRGEAVLCISIQKLSKIRSKYVGRCDMELTVTASGILSEPDLTISKGENVGVASWSSQRDKNSELKSTSLGVSPVNAGREYDQQHIKFGQDIVRHHSSVHLAKYPIRYEVSESFRDVMEHVKMGLYSGQAPKLASEGSGGVYFMKDECGLQNVAVFKPMDEEPMAVNNPRGFSASHFGEGLKRGTRSGEGAIREVAAYILDHPARTKRSWVKEEEVGFAGVPPTAMVRCYHEAFHYNVDQHKLYRKAKIGSLQAFVRAFSSCEDMGSSSFPVEEVHKITVLDLRLANTDRNGGNILVCRGKDGALKLVPIDHGYCLPEKFEECMFEWLYWPQARQPYGHAALAYIETLDAEEDIALLGRSGWNLRPQCALVLRVSTMLLKKGAAAGLTPFQIGSIMSRVGSLDMKSPIELMLEEAESLRLKNMKESDFLAILADLLDDYIASVKTSTQ